MDLQQRTKRFGWYLILCTCVLRLAADGIPGILRRISDLKTSFPTYSETGRNVRFFSSSAGAILHFRESPAPWLPKPEKPEFTQEDAQLVKVDYDCSARPDLGELVQQPLGWDLRGASATVLILHTHTTESYTKNGEDYQETSRYRSLDEDYNMISVGETVARILEEKGIGVIHDRQIHDYPSYNGSYVHSRKSMEELLARYPSIQLVLDLHRDALEKNGQQVPLVTRENGEAIAQLMLVVGTDEMRQAHENWEENLSLALKLQLLLERATPGIMRPINLRMQRFNQDLHPHTLLVEVGTAGNSWTEAQAGAGKLAEAVAALAAGTAGEYIK